MPSKYKKLSRPRNVPLPKRIIFLDTETKKETETNIEYHTFDIGWTAYQYRTGESSYSKPKYIFHETASAMADYIESKCFERSSLWVLAHNIYFDMQASSFFTIFREKGFHIDFFYDKGVTFILSIKHKGKSIVFLSTTNFFAFSLKKLGQYAGLEKLEVDFEEDSKDYIKTYCKRDVEIIESSFNGYISFIKENRLGKLSFTRASQAFNAYRHRFMDFDIHLHQENELAAFEKACYYGGRTEAFVIGSVPGEHFTSLDINSMYPYVMKNYSVPVEYIGTLDDLSEENVLSYLEDFAACAHVHIITDKPAYAYRYNQKIIFPIGDFETYVCSESLKYAITQGHIKQIKRVELYRREKIFTSYIDELYKLKSKYKSEGNELYTQITKIMLNSLYGKFGQHKMEMTTELEWDGEPFFKMEIYDDVTGDILNVTKFLNTTMIENEAEVGDKSFIAVAAHITEAARMLLWSIIDIVGYDNVLYCDTDSIKIRTKDLNKVFYKIDPYELGALDLEEQFTYFHINGAKDYTTDTEDKKKGIPKTAKLNEHGNYEYPQFCGLNSHLRLKQEDRYMIRYIEKIRRSHYNKGYVSPSGKVLPFHFWNNQIVLYKKFYENK